MDTMVKRCAWGTCKSDTRYSEREYMKEVTFFPIPKPKTRLEECKIWVKACGRKNFTVDNVTKHSYICSKHFVENRPTEKYPHPVTAGSKENVKPCRKPPTKRELFPSEDFQTSHTKNFSATCTSMYVPDPAEFVEISASETSRPTNLGLHDSKANQKNNMTGIFIDIYRFFSILIQYKFA